MSNIQARLTAPHNLYTSYIYTVKCEQYGATSISMRRCAACIYVQPQWESMFWNELNTVQSCKLQYNSATLTHDLWHSGGAYTAFGHWRIYHAWQRGLTISGNTHFVGYNRATCADEQEKTATNVSMCSQIN